MKKLVLLIILTLIISYSIKADTISSSLRISGTGQIRGLSEKIGEYTTSENLDKTLDNKKWSFNCYSVQKSNNIFYCIAAANLNYLELTKDSTINRKTAISTDLTANFISIYNLNLKMDNNSYSYKQTGTYYSGYQFKEVKYPVKAGFLSKTQNWLSAYYPYPGKQNNEGAYNLNQFEEQKLSKTDTENHISPTRRVQTETELLFSIDRIIGKQYENNQLVKAFKRELNKVRELKIESEKDLLELNKERDFNEYDKLTRNNKNNNFYFELTNEVTLEKIRLYPLITTLEINTTARISTIDQAGGETYLTPIIYGATNYPIRISFILKKN